MSNGPMRPVRPNAATPPPPAAAEFGATQPAPIATAPTVGVSGPSSGYVSSGQLTSQQLITGEGDKYAFLDPTIVEVTGWVQQALVSENKAEEIELARKDPEVRKQISEEIDRLALQYMLRERRIRGDEGKRVVASVVNEIVGLGPLEPLWQDPTITEVIVNGPNDVFVEQAGKLMRAKACRFRSQDHLLEICQRILSPLNRKVDVRDPLADGRLPDGSRVNIVHQALAPKGPLMTIRRFPEKNMSLVDLVGIGAMDKEMAALIATLISNKCSTLIVGGTGSGKALDVSTPIPTPNGFVAMGDLQVGDTVFDERGEPTTVVGAYDFEYDRSCYEVTFSDGETIVADGAHLWLTDTRSKPKNISRIERISQVRDTTLSREEVEALSALTHVLPSDAADTVENLNRFLGWTDSPMASHLYSAASDMMPVERTKQGNLFLTHELLNHAVTRFSHPWRSKKTFSDTLAVRSTEEIRNTLLTPTGQLNHSVSVAGIAQYPERVLPVDPYVLGVWLGNGDKNSGSWDELNEEIATKMRAAGYKITPDINSVADLDTQLCVLGVLGNKHIPSDYLYSSVKQRRALLAGLLDTQGVATHHGEVEFSNSDYDLVKAVYTLVASLGYKVIFQEKKSEDKGNSYTVAFYGVGGEFHLRHKNTILAAAKTVRNGSPQHEYDRRYIVSVEPVESRPVRCIRVANESHLFLAGKSYVPTHNTTLLNALSVAIPRHERIVTIEDSLELRLDEESHVAAMEARPADASGKNAIPIRNLVKNALRMRPDRIIVGEIRDSAALDMLQACNTGHEGSMSTVHANGPDEAISRLTVMVAQGGEIPADKVEWLVGSAIDLIVMARRYEDGSRRVEGLYEVPDMTDEDYTGALVTIPLWEWEQTGTDDNGRLIGRYVKKNDISKNLYEAKGLEFGKKYSWEDLCALCGRQDLVIAEAEADPIKESASGVMMGDPADENLIAETTVAAQEEKSSDALVVEDIDDELI